jgi:predicted nucleic acid-binding protein
MRLVLDASVAIAASRPHEPSSAFARARVGRALRRFDELVLPTLFGVEVAGALSRHGEPEGKIPDYIARLTSTPHEVIPVRRRPARVERWMSRLRGDFAARTLCTLARVLSKAAALHARPSDGCCALSHLLDQSDRLLELLFAALELRELIALGTQDSKQLLDLNLLRECNAAQLLDVFLAPQIDRCDDRIKSISRVDARRAFF